MEKQRTITISFKKEEFTLYEYLKSYSCPSAVVKDILKKMIKNEK